VLCCAPESTCLHICTAGTCRRDLANERSIRSRGLLSLFHALDLVVSRELLASGERRLSQRMRSLRRMINYSPTQHIASHRNTVRESWNLKKSSGTARYSLSAPLSLPVSIKASNHRPSRMSPITINHVDEPLLVLASRV
jgi:hypothetical protein